MGTGRTLMPFAWSGRAEWHVVELEYWTQMEDFWEAVVRTRGG